jgi:hypothetical protein
MLRAESMVWTHAHILLDAIYQVEKDLERHHGNTNALVKEYGELVDSLHPKPTVQGSKQCAMFHCEHKIKCYNDYLPKYNPAFSLRNITVGQTRWLWNYPTKLTWDKGNYLDLKASYDCTNSLCGDLSFKITVSAVQFVQLVGVLKDVAYYIDLNVAEVDIAKYKRPGSLPHWEKISILQFEEKEIPVIVELFDVPLGQHVLTIAASTSVTIKKNPTISHLLVWG